MLEALQRRMRESQGFFNQDASTMRNADDASKHVTEEPDGISSAESSSASSCRNRMTASQLEGRVSRLVMCDGAAERTGRGQDGHGLASRRVGCAQLGHEAMGKSEAARHEESESVQMQITELDQQLHMLESSVGALSHAAQRRRDWNNLGADVGEGCTNEKMPLSGLHAAIGHAQLRAGVNSTCTQAGATHHHAALHGGEAYAEEPARKVSHAEEMRTMSVRLQCAESEAAKWRRVYASAMEQTARMKEQILDLARECSFVHCSLTEVHASLTEDLGSIHAAWDACKTDTESVRHLEHQCAVLRSQVAELVDDYRESTACLEIEQQRLHQMEGEHEAALHKLSALVTNVRVKRTRKCDAMAEARAHAGLRARLDAWARYCARLRRNRHVSRRVGGSHQARNLLAAWSSWSRRARIHAVVSKWCWSAHASIKSQVLASMKAAVSRAKERHLCAGSFQQGIEHTIQMADRALAALSHARQQAAECMETRHVQREVERCCEAHREAEDVHAANVAQLQQLLEESLRDRQVMCENFRDQAAANAEHLAQLQLTLRDAQRDRDDVEKQLRYREAEHVEAVMKLEIRLAQVHEEKESAVRQWVDQTRAAELQDQRHDDIQQQHCAAISDLVAQLQDVGEELVWLRESIHDASNTSQAQSEGMRAEIEALQSYLEVCNEQNNVLWSELEALRAQLDLFSSERECAEAARRQGNELIVALRKELEDLTGMKARAQAGAHSEGAEPGCQTVSERCGRSERVVCEAATMTDFKTVDSPILEAKERSGEENEEDARPETSREAVSVYVCLCIPVHCV